jgi:hypothetical protein
MTLLLNTFQSPCESHIKRGKVCDSERRNLATVKKLQEVTVCAENHELHIKGSEC